MRTAITSVLGLTVLLAAASVRADDDVCTVDGEPLKGWDCHLEDASVTLEDVWSVEDGMLKCTGTPVGYIHTKQKFKNYQLTLEWRWAPGKPPGLEQVADQFGITLVGFGTSMPELVTSIEASMLGSPGIAIGTAVVVSPVADLYAVPSRQGGDRRQEVRAFREALEKVRVEV